MTNSFDSDSSQDVVVAVMGATGTGKSTFIQLVTGRQDVKIGDTLCSETSDINAYDFTHEHIRYTLIDTPGFDDTNRPDSDIVESILTWCRDSLVSGQKLNGVIYIHSISAPRMAGSALRNVRIFRKLVGVDAFKNVVLATTFWEQVAVVDAESREKELRETPDFWGTMFQKGAKMVRLKKENRTAGLELLQKIGAQSKVILKAQDEIVNEGKAITETDASKEQMKQAEQLERELEAKKQAEKKRIEEELKEKDRLVKEKQQELQREMERKMEEQRKANELARQRAEQLDRENYERQRRQMLAEQQYRQEQYRRECEEIERRRREEVERQRLQQIALREQYQRRYCCIGYRPKWPCDSCGKRVTRQKYYYHCCFCDSNDKYFHCEDCDDDCGDDDHPLMSRHRSPR